LNKNRKLQNEKISFYTFVAGFSLKNIPLIFSNQGKKLNFVFMRNKHLTYDQRYSIEMMLKAKVQKKIIGLPI
tara:strand:+ start:1141 stop:1359 length:219 start_codon:yes stop_codon:yes gene_type:complete